MKCRFDEYLDNKFGLITESKEKGIDVKEIRVFIRLDDSNEYISEVRFDVHFKTFEDCIDFGKSGKDILGDVDIFIDDETVQVVLFHDYPQGGADLLDESRYLQYDKNFWVWMYTRVV